MKKRILSTLLALCMVLALLPSEMARADIKYINSRTDLEAWINGDITYGPIRGDTFAWELQGAQTPPILEIPAERPLTVEGNWEIPSDVTIINRGMAQLRAASSITVNGTWRNVRNGIRSDGQSNLVVNGTFIADGSLAELCNTTVSSGAAISVINGGGLYIPAEHTLKLQNGVTIASPFADAGDGIQYPEAQIRLDGVLLAEGNAVVEPSVVIWPGFISDSSGLPVSNPVLSGALTLGELNVGGNARISANSRVTCEQLNFSSRYIGRTLSVLTVEGELALTGNTLIPPDEGQLVLASSGTLRLLLGSVLSISYSEKNTPAIAGSGRIYGEGLLNADGSLNLGSQPEPPILVDALWWDSKDHRPAKVAESVRIEHNWITREEAWENTPHFDASESSIYVGDTLGHAVIFSDNVQFNPDLKTGASDNPADYGWRAAYADGTMADDFWVVFTTYLAPGDIHPVNGIGVDFISTSQTPFHAGEILIFPGSDAFADGVEPVGQEGIPVRAVKDVCAPQNVKLIVTNNRPVQIQWTMAEPEGRQFPAEYFYVGIVKLKDNDSTFGYGVYGSSVLEASGGGNLSVANGVYTYAIQEDEWSDNFAYGSASLPDGAYYAAVYASAEHPDIAPHGTVVGSSDTWVKSSATAPPTTPTPPSGPSSGGGSFDSGSDVSGTEPPAEPEKTTTTTSNPDGTTTTTSTDKAAGTVTATTRGTDGSLTVVETKSDGTVTTTATDAAGNKTRTVDSPDGSTVTTVERADGVSTTASISADGRMTAQAAIPGEVSAKALSAGQAVDLPLPQLPLTRDTASAPAVTVRTGSSQPIKVSIPVERTTPGTVAVIVHADGNETVVKTSQAAGNSVTAALPDGATVKIVDNSKSFTDVPAASWAADAVAFATARELFSGTGGGAFTPGGDMTRAMLATVLARYEGVDTSGGSSWYEAGMAWAVSQGISDGTSPNAPITREQLATMLYRYAAAAGQDTSASGSLSAFSDGSSVSGYAREAMAWAVGSGLISGDGGALNPAGSATRAQVAAILMRFCQSAA